MDTVRAKKMRQDGSAEFISASVIRPAPHSQNLGIYDGDACIAQSAPAAAIAAPPAAAGEAFCLRRYSFFT